LASETKWITGYYIIHWAAEKRSSTLSFKSKNSCSMSRPVDGLRASFLLARRPSVKSIEPAQRRRRRRRGCQPYPSRFVSLVRIGDRKLMHWRHYLDPLAVVQALGTAVPVRKVD